MPEDICDTLDPLFIVEGLNASESVDGSRRLLNGALLSIVVRADFEASWLALRSSAAQWGPVNRQCYAALSGREMLA